MSANVSVEVVRVDGCIPWDSFYLGQSGTRDALSEEVAFRTPIVNNGGASLYPMTFVQLKDILCRYRDSFYAGHYATELLMFLQARSGEEDDYVTFLVFA